MLLPRFAYHRPAGIAEALALLAEHQDRAAVLAGGTDLLVNLKHKLKNPAVLVDLAGIPGLAQVEETAGALRVGPLCSARGLSRDATVRAQATALALGAGVLGSPQVRNRATVGGNVCNARPAADMCVPLLALGASACLRASEGEREVPLAEFFLGPGATVRRPTEILVGLQVPAAQAGAGSGYQKLGLRKALEIALVNVAAFLTLEKDGKTIAGARVALGSVAPTPILSPGAAAALVGREAGPAALAQAGEAAAADCRPIDDHRGSAAYRRDMVAVLTRRALEAALAQAQGN
ncbi:MAG: xanthine dehydrogenase family protein subunit M [Deltaproteobacteria bacterium]|nr:xanthine dehydrogenase family protein subunit M [Deltaproteobacteria bacterium]